jgi:hypothetical protein
MMQFVLPFLINFGVNKAMGMSTGKALGLAGVQAFAGPAASTSTFAPGTSEIASLGSSASQGGIGGIVGSALQGGAGLSSLTSGPSAQALLMEGGKTLLSSQLDKRYGINPMLTYGGVTALQGGIGGLGEGGKGFLEGAKGSFANPVTGQPVMASSVPGKESASVLGLGKESGITGLGTGADIGLGIGATTFLSGMGEGEEPKKTEEKVNENYPNVKDIVTNFNIKDPVTGKTSKLAIGETPEERFMKVGYTPRYKDGGIAQFNQGALVSMLPGKSVSDEKDPSIYKRAYNFVTDETGNGDMDEDTMLAQLADGEFVTTAKAVLGAGIFQGAKPSDIGGMRDKGAKFFYEQQARFKRIYEMLEEAKQSKEQAA